MFLKLFLLVYSVIANHSNAYRRKMLLNGHIYMYLYLCLQFLNITRYFTFYGHFLSSFICILFSVCNLSNKITTFITFSPVKYREISVK